MSEKEKVDKAIKLYNDGKYQEAIDAFSSVLEVCQDNAELYNNIALCYANLGEYEKAEKYYLKAQELNPKLAQVYINLADIYYRRKDMASGIGLVTTGLVELPDNLVLRHYLARFYMEDAKLDLAIDELENILEKQPDNFDVYYDLGRVHFELGNYASAIENFENVLEYKSENPWIYYYLGEAYEANDEIDKALSNFLKAIARNDSFSPAYKKAGILFFARGDYEDTMIVYAIVTHLHLVPFRNSLWLFNIASVVAFYSVLMTFFGVNYFLSGMHSYGQNDHVGGLFVYLLLSALLVALIGFISFARRQKQNS